MRFKLAREIAISEFSDPEDAPDAESTRHVSLDDWVADKAGSLPTLGNNTRLRFLDANGVELLGGGVDFRVWGNTVGGFWVASALVEGADGSHVYNSSLTGDLYIQVTGISIDDIATAVTLQILVQEAG